MQCETQLSVTNDDEMRFRGHGCEPGIEQHLVILLRRKPANRADKPAADATRWVRPAQLAEVIVFLLSDAAAAVTGALIPVKGRV